MSSFHRTSLSLGRAGAVASPVTVVMATDAYKQQSLYTRVVDRDNICSDLVGGGERTSLRLQCYWQLTLDLSISVIKESKIAQWLLIEGGGEDGEGAVVDLCGGDGVEGGRLPDGGKLGPHSD